MWILAVILLFSIDAQGVVFHRVILLPIYFLSIYLVVLAFTKLHGDDLPVDNMCNRDQVAHNMWTFLESYGYADMHVIKLLHTETLDLLKRASGKDWITRYLPVIISSVISPLATYLVDLAAGLDDLGFVILFLVAFGVSMCVSIQMADWLVQAIRDLCPYTRSEVQRFYDDLTSLLLRLEAGKWEELPER